MYNTEEWMIQYDLQREGYNFFFLLSIFFQQRSDATIGVNFKRGQLSRDQGAWALDGT